ncbi:MAG: hypothetical protein C0498_02860 [Anaerolinea sp.]|nr:hypothetical protein [Anaerolinea sp.]
MLRLLRYRILYQTAALVGLVLAAKVGLHALGWEFIAMSPLHTSIVAGGIFILSIVLAGVLPDYKEAERLTSDFTATIDNMYEDGMSIQKNYPEFESTGFREALTSTLAAFRDDIVHNRRKAYEEIHEISDALAQMELAKVPPNFIVKLKQEQGALIRVLLRLYYIQRVRFMPSAYHLVISTAAIVIGVLLFTNLEPFNASAVALALVAFIFIYLIRLIGVASTPFHRQGATQDDVSLFLVEEALKHLRGDESDQKDQADSNPHSSL